MLNPQNFTLQPSYQYAIPDVQDEVLDRPISRTEVRCWLDKSKDRKAPGADGIPVEFFKYANDDLIDILANEFNRIFETGNIPTCFQQSVIFPILKKGDPNQAENYRGIAFLNSTLKIMMGVLAKRFQNWISQNKLLSEFQAGFRESYSTIDQIFIINTIAQNFIREKKKLYAFFVDLKAAFDTVDRSALFYKLYNIGMSRKFGRLIEKIYEKTTSAVWDGKQLSDFFETVTGVKQGCNLSPQAFVLFIDDITDYLCGGVRIGGILVKVLMYADDLVLFADTPQRLQGMINQLKNYCDEWRLQININKSKTMVFRRGGGRYTRNEKWFLDGQEIETVKSYKYLGMNMRNNMNMEQHFQEKLSAAKSAISAAWKNCLEDRHISPKIKYRIFQAVSKSIMLYGAQVWGCKQYDSVEKLLRFFLKRIFKLPQCSPNNMLLVETGISPLFIETLKLHLDFITKTMSLSGDRLTKRIASYAIGEKTLFYKEWETLAEFSECNLDITLDNIPQWKEKFGNLIKAVDEKMRAVSIEKVRSSYHREIYASLNHNLCERNYFNETFSNDLISTVFKIRGEMIDLNFVPHREDLPILCSLCNLRERENVYHFLGRCPVLREFRLQIFEKLVLEESEMKTILDGADWNKLYNYCQKALKYRRAIIRESF